MSVRLPTKWLWVQVPLQSLIIDLLINICRLLLDTKRILNLHKTFRKRRNVMPYVMPYVQFTLHPVSRGLFIEFNRRCNYRNLKWAILMIHNSYTKLCITNLIFVFSIIAEFRDSWKLFFSKWKILAVRYVTS